MWEYWFSVQFSGAFSGVWGGCQGFTEFQGIFDGFWGCQERFCWFQRGAGSLNWVCGGFEGFRECLRKFQEDFRDTFTNTVETPWKSLKCLGPYFSSNFTCLRIDFSQKRFFYLLATFFRPRWVRHERNLCAIRRNEQTENNCWGESIVVVNYSSVKKNKNEKIH